MKTGVISSLSAYFFRKYSTNFRLNEVGLLLPIIAFTLIVIMLCSFLISIYTSMTSIPKRMNSSFQLVILSLTIDSISHSRYFLKKYAQMKRTLPYLFLG